MVAAHTNAHQDASVACSRAQNDKQYTDYQNAQVKDNIWQTTAGRSGNDCEYITAAVQVDPAKKNKKKQNKKNCWNYLKLVNQAVPHNCVKWPFKMLS